MIQTRPIILCISGHDPIGGAGIQADIETLHALECRATTVITSLTVQDTVRVYRYQACDPLIIAEQIEAVLTDMPVSVVKMGMLGSRVVAEAVVSALLRHRKCPWICDPVLSSGANDRLCDEKLAPFLLEHVFPHCDLITPNVDELCRLTQQNTIEEAAKIILNSGCRSLLVTGTDQATEQVEHRFYQHDHRMESFVWPRLPHDYHGSGCTLAAACSAWLARGLSRAEAVKYAQKYTWNTLLHAKRTGRGQILPER